MEAVIDIKTLAMLALTGSVAAGYIVIALVVAPKIRMATASPRMVATVRGAAMIFFLGCGFTHLHLFAHTLGVGGSAWPVETHELGFHVLQAAGAWLFILGAALKLELHVVPSQRTTKQRDLARAKLAEQQAVSAVLERRAARASALARISEQALVQAAPAALVHDAAAAVRKALPPGCTVTVVDGELERAQSGGDPLLVLPKGDGDTEDQEFVTSANNLLRTAVRRLQLEDELRHRSLHDPLTGLPNRVLLVDRLEQALRRQPRAADPVSVLFVDLDGFKAINDAYGHGSGDLVLQEVAARLRAVARADDTIARLSGDEFVMVCERTRRSTALGIARRLVDSISRPYALDDDGVEVTGSVGVVTSSPDSDADDLLRRADIAMYRAKERGPGRVEAYDGAQLARMARRERMDRDLGGALDRGEFSLLYQPMVGAATDRSPVLGAEALLRWRHPTDGLVAPMDFIPVAERRGLIGPINDWIVTMVCAQAARWRAQMPADSPLVVALNASAYQLADQAFPRSFVAALLAAGARPEYLAIEIAERAVTDSDRDPARLARSLLELRSYGLRIALDGFGTGSSSLSHLRTLPLDILKVDGSFIAGTAGGKDRAIVRAVAGLARDLGVEVVAERIETHDQLATVRDLRFDMAQGFLVGRPLRPAGVADLLPAADRSTMPQG